MSRPAINYEPSKMSPNPIATSLLQFLFLSFFVLKSYYNILVQFLAGFECIDTQVSQN